MLLELNEKTATYLLSGLQRFYAHIIYFKERKITLAAGNFKGFSIPITDVNMYATEV